MYLVMEEEPALNSAYCALEFRRTPPPPRLPTTLGDFLQGRALRFREVTRFSQGHTANKGESKDSEHRFHSGIHALPVLPSSLSLRVTESGPAIWGWENRPLRTQALALRI